MNNVRAKCIEVFSSVMEVPGETISDASSPDNLEQWDSLSHVRLIVALEKAFSIQVSPEDGIDLENFGMIQAFVEKKLS